MAHEEDHLSPEELEQRAWEMMEKIRFALFATWDGEKQAAWPLSALIDRKAGRIAFLVSNAKGHYKMLERFPAVTLGFADPGGSDYVVVNGHAALSNDRARIRELFTPFAKAWWTDADDPDIRLLTVTPERLEVWDGPNRVVAGAVMLTAALTGAKPAVGDHGAVRL